MAVIWYIALVLLPLVIQCDDRKRLLINDPAVNADRIHKLEQLVSVLNASLTNLQVENLQQKEKINTLEATKSARNSAIGSTYIRWGKTHCPNNSRTEQVYSGFAAGGHYNQQGNGAEYVCLPEDPNFGKTAGINPGYIYGAEYDSFGFFKTNSMDEDVPCVMCRTLDTSSTIMIPGKNVCYSGWKTEYHGYLASARHDHPGQSSYACVDINPDFLYGGVDDHQGKLFCSVIAKCGSLKCPPYINDYPLTCVVCSK